MSFTKQELITFDDLHIGCLTCSTACLEAPMDMVIAVGFGSAFVTKDKTTVYEESKVENDEYLTVGDIEKLAKTDPEHDWRIHKHGPLHGEVFQRHDEGKWVCIESDSGFA